MYYLIKKILMKETLAWLFLLALSIVIGSIILSQKSNQVWNNNWMLTNAISVQWQEIISLKPNITKYSFSANEKNVDSKQALEIANQKINKVRQILKDSWIKDEDITSTNISVNPNYEYSSTWSTQTGYVANHSLQVKFRDFNLAWKVIDQAWALSWINVNSLWNDIENRDSLLSEARALAFKKAQSKAQELAKISWVSLWKVVWITESSDSFSPRPIYAMAKMADGWSETTINEWTQDVNVYVNVIFEIK